MNDLTFRCSVGFEPVSICSGVSVLTFEWPVRMSACSRVCWMELCSRCPLFIGISHCWRCDQNNQHEWCHAKAKCFLSLKPISDTPAMTRCESFLLLSKNTTKWFLHRSVFCLSPTANHGADLWWSTRSIPKIPAWFLRGHFLPQHGWESEYLLGTTWPEQVCKHRWNTKRNKHY